MVVTLVDFYKEITQSLYMGFCFTFEVQLDALQRSLPGRSSISSGGFDTLSIKTGTDSLLRQARATLSSGIIQTVAVIG